MLRRLSRDAVVYGGSDLLFKLLQFALIPVYTAYLTVGQFGLMALVQVAALLIGAISNLGVNYSVQRFYYERKPGRSRSALVSTGLFELLVSAGIAVSCSLLLSYAFRNTLRVDFQLTWPLIAFALAAVLPDQIAQYSLAMCQWQFSPGKFAFLSLIKNVLGLAVGVWLLIDQDMGLLGIFIGNFIGACVAAPLGIWLVRHDLSPVIERQSFRTLIRFGVPFMFSVLAFWAFTSLDRWLLARLTDAVQVGLFSVAFKFASAISVAIAAFQQAWMPMAAHLVEQDSKHRATLARVISSWIFGLSLLGCGLSIFGADILRFLTPEPYWPAAPLLSLVAMAVVLSGVTQAVVISLFIAKRTSVIGLGAWFAALVNISLNLLLIPFYGSLGSAVATWSTHGLLAATYLWWGQRVYPLPFKLIPSIYTLSVILAGTVVAFIPIGQTITLPFILLKFTILALIVLGAIPAGVARKERLQQLARLLLRKRPIDGPG